MADTLCDEKWDTLLWKTVYMLLCQNGKGWCPPMASAVAPTRELVRVAKPVALFWFESEEKRSEGNHEYFMEESYSAVVPAKGDYAYQDP